VKLPARAAWIAAMGTACSSAPPSNLAIRTPPTASSSAAAAALPSTKASKSADSDTQRRVAEFLSRVAAVRQLEPRAPVEARELDRAELIASVREHVAREVPRDVIRNQGELLVGFGLVPPDFDYEEGAFRLLEAQLAGFYEPHDKKMYLASDLPERAADATLAHELVHALQDQHYDLGAQLSYQPAANDRESALQALAEGDATSAMMDLLLKDTHRRAIDVPDDVFAAEVESSMTGTAEGNSVPRVLRASLVAPYVDGILFVHALRRRGIAKSGGVTGGDDAGWSAVDAAWKRPPETTEQLLHVDKYDAREPGESIAVPPPPGPGWASVYDDVFGEEGLRIAVEETVPAKSAAAAARGWGGDRVALFRLTASTPVRQANDEREPDAGPGVSLAVAWHIRFDRGPKQADAEAREAFKALADAMRPGSGTTPSVCVERAELGPIALARSGRDITIVAGPYRRAGKRVASASDCRKSLRWATDVLGKPKP
jgi:hypothetical protein